MSHIYYLNFILLLWFIKKKNLIPNVNDVVPDFEHLGETAAIKSVPPIKLLLLWVPINKGDTCHVMNNFEIQIF